MAIHFHRTTHGFDKNETVAVVAVENDSLKVQRADGTETFFHLGQGSALCDVGEKRKLKIAAGDKLLLQANTAGANDLSMANSSRCGRFRAIPCCWPMAG
jgi:hypothetical protein